MTGKRNKQNLEDAKTEHRKARQQVDQCKKNLETVKKVVDVCEMACGPARRGGLKPVAFLACTPLLFATTFQNVASRQCELLSLELEMKEAEFREQADLQAKQTEKESGK